MITRRRFISISAAGLAAPQSARANASWHGTALGARTSITLRHPPENAKHIFSAVQDELQRIEAQFSLYQPNSALSRLNRYGLLRAPSADFLSLCAEVSDVHALTAGRFDPTVQTIWDSLDSGDAMPKTSNIGWQQVTYTRRAVKLGPRQKLTFNGIAQGFATDKITALIRQFGLRDVLVNIGEYRASGRPFRLGIADPGEGLIGTVQLTDAAVATSSAAADQIAGRSHLIDPGGTNPPHWSTVSVVAKTAALADGASTAFALMSRNRIRDALDQDPRLIEVHLVSHSGRYQRLTAKSPT